MNRQKVLGFFTDAGMYDLVERIVNPIEMHFRMTEYLDAHEKYLQKGDKAVFTFRFRGKVVYSKVVENSFRCDSALAFVTKFEGDTSNTFLSGIFGLANNDMRTKYAYTRKSGTVITNIL